jgi:protein phosphatase
MQNLFQKVSKPISSAISGKADKENATANDTAPSGDDEMGLVLDGPAAEAMKRQEEADKQRAPKLGSEPSSIHGQFRLDVGGATSMGRVRNRNEDSFLLQQMAWSNLEARHDAALLVVADGMGGHEAGDRASLLALQQIGNVLRTALVNAAPGQSEAKQAGYRESIEAAIRSANTVVYQTGQKEAPGKGMGATAAVVLARDGQVEIGHVGDCRVYLFHDGSLSQVTRDQTLVARMVELGQLTEKEAKNHPKGNEVTQAIGKGAEIQPAYYQARLVPGDWMVVACDGLHAHVDAARLTETLHAAPFSAALVAHHLVDLANFHGGTDNCTVVALRCY